MSMYAAWPNNICSKSTSLPSSKAFRLADISLSLYLSLPIGIFWRQIQVVPNSVTRSLSINITPKYYVTKKRACNVLFSEFPAPSVAGNLNNFRLSKLEARMNFKKQNIPKKLNFLKSFMNLLPFERSPHIFTCKTSCCCFWKITELSCFISEYPKYYFVIGMIPWLCTKL